MANTLKTRVFIVNTGSDAANPNTHRIEAAYYKTEDGFTTFKDVDNQAVFTVRDHHLVTVERADSDEPVMATFRQALQRATEEGSATVSFRNGSTDEASGRTTETGYDITVTRFDSVSSAA